MQQLVECVPNFSNGRDPEVYSQIAASISNVKGVTVLDVSADPDHNRTVITFVGAPEPVEQAAFEAIKKAAELIDLDYQEGEHPRIGATDVCPFIPIKDVSMDYCVEMSRRVGARVGEELGIAVYLYAEAATRPERARLAAIRKGEYELWKIEVATNPDRQPDFGPAEPKPWGATVIGARPFLIAYNLYLNSDNADIADQIARNIRFSSGGLRNIQAKGFLVEGQAQVSMNLTDFEKTPIYRVQELVRREATHYGLAITKAELIGLTPQQALVNAARWYLQLDEMHDSQILEYRLQEEVQEDATPEAFIEATAEPSPTPGGGSAAALAGALAAALTQMVAGLTTGRKKYADVAVEAETIKQEAARLRRRLTEAIPEDAAAFENVMNAYRLKDVTEEEKAAAIEEATLTAAKVPLCVAELSLEAAQLASDIAGIGNVNAATDAAAGALLAQAAVAVAVLNVKVNARSLQDKAKADDLREEVAGLENQVAEVVKQVQKTAAERGGY
ncbi:MAG: glutamate formimidoyltransferase [Candidatus Promineifilaceae bacterium]|jgi:glutamate formiminotransferase/formiminotetrahydrofolate cyclodeaminase